MKKNISNIYTIVVIIALVLLGAWSAWDVYQLRASNSEAAIINIEKIKTTIEDSHNSGIPFNDNQFFKIIRSLFNENTELEILTIYSHDEDVGIEYHYDRGEEIQMLNLSEQSSLGMKDLPDYKYNQLLKTKLTKALNVKDQSGLDLDVIYQVVDRKVIFNILIRVLIVIIVLFLTTLLMIFLVSRTKESDMEIGEDDEFSSDSSDEEEMSLGWDENGFDGDDSLDSNGNKPAFDNLSLDEDFSDIDLSDNSDDFNDLNFDKPLDLSADSDEFDDLSFDDALSDDFSDLEIDSDVPEEEDLLAMDHEISPTDDIEDFSFDNMDNSFSDDFSTDDSPSLYSPKSGVNWERFIEEKVNLELDKASSQDRDLVIGVIQCESLNEDNHLIFADQLKEDFNYSEIISEYQEKEIALIIPTVDLDDALKTLKTFSGKELDEYGEVNIGISSRNGRLITGNRIFMEAENALHKAIGESEKNIVGFRSDPDKFKDFLSNKG